MNSFLRFGFCLLLCCLGAPALRAQQGIPERINHDHTRGRSLEQLEAQAQAAFNDKEYYKSIKLYQLVVGQDSLRRTAWYGLAQSAVAHGAYRYADTAYTMLLRHHMVELEPEEMLLAADIKYRLGTGRGDSHYRDAGLLYDTLTRHPEASADVRRSAVRGQHLVRWAQDSVGTRTDLAFLPLDTATINTPAHSEFAPFPLKDTLYYSAYRIVQEAGVLRPERERMQVWYAPSLETGQPAPGAPNFNEKERHTAHTAFTPDGRTQYYSECRGEQGSADLECTLYRRERQPDGAWGAAQRLPLPVNLAGSTSAEPTVGHLPGDTSAVLFFVSDRAGSRQRDIWYSRIYRDSFGAAEPLAAVNTAGNDVTPFFHHESSTLYFSTDGRNTLGGLDVYCVRQTPTAWAAVEHLDRPVNTGANDVFYTRSVGGKYEFWASNRRGLANTSEDDCCYDLFASGAPVLKAIAFHERTRDSLAGTRMQLFDVTSGSPVALGPEVDVPGTNHSWPIASSRKYMVTARKEFFTSDTAFVTTGRLAEDVYVHLYLNQGQVRLLVTVCNTETKADMPDATVRTQRMTAPPAALAATDSLPGVSRYTYALDWNQDYAVAAEKSGYSAGAATVSTRGLDFTRDTTLEVRLCLARGILLTVRAREKFTKEPINGATFFAYEVETPKAVKEFTDPNGNVYHDTIGYNKHYVVVAAKDNYTTDSVDIRTLERLLPKSQNVHIDTVIELIQLLPITLYFNNALPNVVFMANKDPKKTQYGTTYFEYQPKKEEFIAAYTEGLTGLRRDRAAASIDSFFEKGVKRGWETLRAFSEILYPRLQNGDTVRLILRGYASPLGNTAYNKLLTGRRVASVHNHFRFFDEFVRNDTYGQFYGTLLFIDEQPMGEVNDPIDDSPDRRKSVYSVAASHARRLVIEGAVISPKNGNPTIRLSNNKKNPTP